MMSCGSSDKLGVKTLNGSKTDETSNRMPALF